MDGQLALDLVILGLFCGGSVSFWLPSFLRPKRDFYVVERRFVERNAATHYADQRLLSSYAEGFDDCLAARAYFDLHENCLALQAGPHEEQWNYAFAVSSSSRLDAIRYFRKSANRTHWMLMTTPYSVRSQVRKEVKANAAVHDELNRDSIHSTP